MRKCPPHPNTRFWDSVTRQLVSFTYLPRIFDAYCRSSYRRLRRILFAGGMLNEIRRKRYILYNVIHNPPANGSPAASYHKTHPTTGNSICNFLYWYITKTSVIIFYRKSLFIFTDIDRRFHLDHFGFLRSTLSRATIDLKIKICVYTHVIPCRVVCDNTSTIPT